MRTPTLLIVRVALFALALAAIAAPSAQGQAPTMKGVAPPAPVETASLDVLKGSWVRPDGGYTIVIKGVSPTGQIEAMYFNPNALPFAKAQAAKEGGVLAHVLRIARGRLRRLDLRTHVRFRE